MTDGVSRRRVLAGGLAVVGVGLGGWRLLGDDGGDGDGQSADEATRFVAEEGIAADESIRDDARRLGVLLESAGDSGSFGRRAQVLDQLVAEDFATGRVLVLGGWHLARSEVALAVYRASLGAERPVAVGDMSGEQAPGGADIVTYPPAP